MLTIDTPSTRELPTNSHPPFHIFTVASLPWKKAGTSPAATS